MVVMAKLVSSLKKANLYHLCTKKARKSIPFTQEGKKQPQKCRALKEVSTLCERPAIKGCEPPRHAALSDMYIYACMRVAHVHAYTYMHISWGRRLLPTRWVFRG